MPHVVFSKGIDLEKFIENFNPIIEKENNFIKIENIFLDKNKREALLPVVIINEKKQNFFAQILCNPEKTTVRLLPLTDPEKTDAVKSSLGMIAKKISEFEPSLNITKTNIEEFIPK